MKNYRIITAPNLLKGINLLGWVLIATTSVIIFDVVSIFFNIPISLALAVPNALIMYSTIRIKTDRNPDFIMIAFIRFSKIKNTINASNFKGNCYVS